MTPEEIMERIRSDPGAVTVTLTQEAITEPKGVGLFRSLTQRITSGLEPLHFVSVEIVYVWPANSPAWGAERSHTFVLREVK